ncbi:hypothetical protein PS647_02388 [Pseudomonas fluorescens]|jgi:hypothetical protein|nr:hypothetical protein PS647_02388 [Pseudomonas fluorescens]
MKVQPSTSSCFELGERNALIAVVSFESDYCQADCWLRSTWPTISLNHLF